MSDIILAVKPKYPTRKAVDKILTHDGDFVNLVHVQTSRQAEALFDTSYVAMVYNDNYYPMEIDNVSAQYALVNAGEAPSVEAKEDFGVKKIESFFSSDDVECYNGKLTGNLESLDGKYTLKLKFDSAAAATEGYTDIKINGSAIGAENVIEFASANEVKATIISVTATLDEDSIEMTFENKLNPVVVEVSNATISADTPAIDIDGTAYETFRFAWANAVASGATININKAVVDETTDAFEIANGKEVTINLASTLTLAQMISLNNGTINVTGSGTIISSGKHGICCTNTDENVSCYVNIAKDVTIINSKNAAVAAGAKVQNFTTVCHGTLIGFYYGYASNGTDVNTVFTCDGTLKSTAADTEEPLGAYLASDGTYTFTDVNIETAGTCVEIRAGELTISGGKFVSTSTLDAAMHAGPSGSCAVSTGISASKHSTLKDITVNVSGVTVDAKAAMFFGNPGNYDGGTMTINITDGAFIGEVKTLTPDTDPKNFLYGGRYSKKPDDMYIAAGYTTSENMTGTFDIVKA